MCPVQETGRVQLLRVYITLWLWLQLCPSHMAALGQVGAESMQDGPSRSFQPIWMMNTPLL